MSYFPWMQKGKHQGATDTIEIERDRSPSGLASRRGALKALVTGGAVAIAGGIPLTLGAARPS